MNFKTFSHFSQSRSLLTLNCYFISSYKIFSISKSTNAAVMSVEDINKSVRKLKHAKHSGFSQSAPATVTLQILGAGVRGTPASLYVSSDHIKYIFNCGEGTQRLAHEHHSRLTKLEQIFFTTPTWKNMGGLPGMALTIQDAGVPKLNIHGPKGIGTIFDTVKRFVMLTNLTVTEASCDEGDVYQDACMTVNYVHLKESTTNKSDDDVEEILYVDDTDYYAHEVYKYGKKYTKKRSPERVVQPQPKKLFSKKVTGSIAYICKLSSKAGFLNLSKCVDMGVPPGPLLGKLKAGQDVHLDDGTVVKSTDVCDARQPGPAFIVLECPNEDYLDSLLSSEKFKDYENSGVHEKDLECIVHFTPEKMMRHPRYIEWMRKFPLNVHHMIINENNRCISYEAKHRMQQKLHLLHPTMFPMLHENNIEDPEDIEASNKIFDDLNIHRSKVLNAFYLRPPDGLDKEVEVTLNRKASVDAAMEIDGFLDALAELQTDINARSKFIKDSPEFPKILLLGTGSSIPSKVRNTSAILLRVDEDTSILLDCAEGTAGQIISFFGSEADRIFSTIKAVYVSHLHADHHLGLLGVLQERHKTTDEPIFLLAPKQIELWLRLYHKMFEPIDDKYILVPNLGLLMTAKKFSEQTKRDLYSKLKIKDVSTIEVFHCSHSFGVSWTLESGIKIVYSGDTRPCQPLVILGENCDLLIHEATMEVGMEEEAKKKGHSSISQAIEIGNKMNAKFIFLTHFSQRYSKIPRLPENTDELNFSNVGIAFDNMQFNMAELTLLPLYYPSLRLMFSEFYDLLEVRAQKRRKWNEVKEARQESLERMTKKITNYYKT